MATTETSFINDRLLSTWETLRLLVEEMELDVSKNVKGNSSAGVRVRKSSRELRALCTQLIRSTLEGREAAKEARAARRAAKKEAAAAPAETAG